MKVLFCCNADSIVGFGHLRRCLILAEEVRSRRNQVSFEGDFAPAARELITRSNFKIMKKGHTESFDAGLLDWMFDSENMDHYEPSLISNFASSCERSVLLSSSVDIPDDLPVDLVIGYVLSPPATPSFSCLSSLKFAPVPPGWEEKRNLGRKISSEIGKVLMAFGAWKDETPLIKTLEGLKSFGFSGAMDCLLAHPHRKSKERFLEVAEDCFSIQFHEEVPDVGKLLVENDLVVGGYGNLTYEALALGTPFLCVPLKRFQFEYARTLEEKGLLCLLDLADDLSSERIATSLGELDYDQRKLLASNGMSAIDVQGLGRVVDALLAKGQIERKETQLAGNNLN
jgi:UDP-2,4-diacetamido-2,4,6-trideoxy-beta-L-altropyranose hydrolase